MAAMSCLIEQTTGRSLALSGQVAGVTVLLALVFITDRPFLGGNSVQPTAIVKVIDILEARKN